jgi:hypothetical protein
MGCTTFASILVDDVMVSEDQGHKRGNTPSTTFLFPSEAESGHDREEHERHYLGHALTSRVNVIGSSGTLSLFMMYFTPTSVPSGASYERQTLQTICAKMQAKRNEPQHLTGFASGPPPCY